MGGEGGEGCSRAGEEVADPLVGHLTVKHGFRFYMNKNFNQTSLSHHPASHQQRRGPAAGAKPSDIYIYIRRPLVGHQAVRHSFEVYNSIASIDRLQTSKYIALLTSMFTASFSAVSMLL